MKLSKYTTFLLFVAVNTPASLAIDVVWEPTELILGVPTEVRFYIQANDEDFAPAGGGISISDVNDGTPLPSAVPDGGLFFDLDGPDDIDFTGDDGWKWQGGIDGSQGFTTQVNPPEFIYFGVIGNSPFVVPAGTRLLAASLVITGTELGAFRLAPIYTLFDESFNEVPVKDGLETVFDVVEGSGRLGACCFDDGTCTVAGLGACVGGPANWFEERECDVCSIEPSEPCDEACGDIDHWMHDPACQPGVDRLDSSIVTFGLSFSPNDEDCSVDAIVRTRGTSWINTFGPMDDSSRYPDTRALDEHLDVRDTEVVSIDTISPDGLVRMTAGRDRGAAALRPSYGTLAEQPAEPALADGFFDLYTEIEVLRDDGEVLVRLYNQDPARVEAVVDCIPAEANYRSSPGCIALYTSPIDGEGVHVANLVSAEYRTFEATCFETIGGAVYADCDDVITSGETNVQVTVAGTEGNYVAVTSGPSGVWSIPFVPCGEYVVTPHRVFREYCHVEPGGACPSTLCATSTQITVDADHRGPNLSVQFVGLPDCITNDMNYDELCTVTFDADETLLSNAQLEKERDEARAEAYTAREHAQMAKTLASQAAARVSELETAAQDYPEQLRKLKDKCLGLEAQARAQHAAATEADWEIRQLKEQAKTQHLRAEAELAKALAEAQAAATAERRADLETIATLRQERDEARAALAQAHP